MVSEAKGGSMKRLICGVALVVALAGLAVTSALAAGGKGSQTLGATCTINNVTSSVTIHASNGGSAWLNNTHWVLLSITTTFTPTGGTPTTVTKVYGSKSGLQSRTHGTCSGSGSNPSGAFSFTATAVKTTH
jgi:hypothetical protein